MEESRLSELYSEVINIDKEKLVSFLKCQLCTGIFRNPHTINECMHTFCKSCIYKYFLSNPAHDSCPVCNVKLGGKPIETLIYDNSIAVLIEILFPEFEEIDKENCVNFLYLL